MCSTVSSSSVDGTPVGASACSILTGKSTSNLSTKLLSSGAILAEHSTAAGKTRRCDSYFELLQVDRKLYRVDGSGNSRLVRIGVLKRTAVRPGNMNSAQGAAIKTVSGRYVACSICKVLNGLCWGFQSSTWEVGRLRGARRSDDNVYSTAPGADLQEVPDDFCADEECVSPNKAAVMSCRMSRSRGRHSRYSGVENAVSALQLTCPYSNNIQTPLPTLMIVALALHDHLVGCDAQPPAVA